MTEIELHPGTPFCTAQAFNRIARQQGLDQVMTKAVIFDEICQAMPLPEATEAELVQRYLEQNGLRRRARLIAIATIIATIVVITG